jgi:hypothetical protein
MTSEPQFPLTVLSDFSKESYAKGYEQGQQDEREAAAQRFTDIATAGKGIVIDGLQMFTYKQALDAIKGDSGE